MVRVKNTGRYHKQNTVAFLSSKRQVKGKTPNTKNLKNTRKLVEPGYIPAYEHMWL